MLGGSRARSEEHRHTALDLEPLELAISDRTKLGDADCRRERGRCGRELDGDRLERAAALSFTQRFDAADREQSLGGCFVEIVGSRAGASGQHDELSAQEQHGLAERRQRLVVLHERACRSVDSLDEARIVVANARDEGVDELRGPCARKCPRQRRVLERRAELGGDGRPRIDREAPSDRCRPPASEAPRKACSVVTRPQPQERRSTSRVRCSTSPVLRSPFTDGDQVGERVVHFPGEGLAHRRQRTSGKVGELDVVESGDGNGARYGDPLTRKHVESGDGHQVIGENDGVHLRQAGIALEQAFRRCPPARVREVPRHDALGMKLQAMAPEGVLDATAPSLRLVVSLGTGDERELSASVHDQEMLGQRSGAGFVAHRVTFEPWDFDADDDDGRRRKTARQNRRFPRASCRYRPCARRAGCRRVGLAESPGTLGRRALAGHGAFRRTPRESRRRAFRRRASANVKSSRSKGTFRSAVR